MQVKSGGTVYTSITIIANPVCSTMVGCVFRGMCLFWGITPSPVTGPYPSHVLCPAWVSIPPSPHPRRGSPIPGQDTGTTSRQDRGTTSVPGKDRGTTLAKTGVPTPTTPGSPSNIIHKTH